MTPNERAEFTYLLERSSRHFGSSDWRRRDTGISSNAMVAYALGGHFPEHDQYPNDRDDYKACIRAARKAPWHLRPKLRAVLRAYREHLEFVMKHGSAA